MLVDFENLKEPSYTKEEKARLARLGICYTRFYPERLKIIVRYFKGCGSIYGITEKYYEGVKISTKTARHLKKIVQAGELDWVLDRWSVEKITISKSAIKKLSDPQTAEKYEYSTAVQIS